MKTLKINSEIYRGCGKVKAALDSNGQVVDVLYKGQISPKAKSYEEWCVDQNFGSTRYTEKRIRMYNDYESDCWYAEYLKEKEIFKKKNKNCEFFSGMASCGQLIIFA